eukprot:s2872_g6.t1
MGSVLVLPGCAQGDANGTYHQERGVWTELQCRCLTVAMCIFGWDCNEFKVVAQHVPNRIGVEVVRWAFQQGRGSGHPRLGGGAWASEQLNAGSPHEKGLGGSCMELQGSCRAEAEEHRRCEFWVMSLGLKNRTHHQIKARFRELCPEESNLLDRLPDRRRPRSELSAGDFLMHLKEDESGRLTTDDKRAEPWLELCQSCDRHLSRINEMRLKMMKGAQNGCEGSEMEPVQDIAVTSKRQRVARKKEAVPAPAAETTGQEETKEEEVLEVAGDARVLGSAEKDLDMKKPLEELRRRLPVRQGRFTVTVQMPKEVMQAAKAAAETSPKVKPVPSPAMGPKSEPSNAKSQKAAKKAKVGDATMRGLLHPCYRVCRPRRRMPQSFLQKAPRLRSRSWGSEVCAAPAGRKCSRDVRAAGV